MAGTRTEQLWTIRNPNTFGIRAPTVLAWIGRFDLPSYLDDICMGSDTKYLTPFLGTPLRNTSMPLVQCLSVTLPPTPVLLTALRKLWTTPVNFWVFFVDTSNIYGLMGRLNGNLVSNFKTNNQIWQDFQNSQTWSRLFRGSWECPDRSLSTRDAPGSWMLWTVGQCSPPTVSWSGQWPP